MRVIIQRVKESKVVISGKVQGKIMQGLLVLCGFENSDEEGDLNWLAKKIVNLRIFNDNEGIMNLSLLEINGEILIVSQFTLHAKTKKGNRPSYIMAASPEKAIPLYEAFIMKIEAELGKKVQTGIFGAMMDVHLINDGPVTIFIDSKSRD